MKRHIDLTARHQMLLLYWAWGFAVAYFCSYAFLIKLLPLPPATLNASDVAEFYLANSMSVRAGATVCAWSGAFAVPFSIVIATQMARIEQGFPLWSMVQLAGGVMMSIFVVLPPMCWGVAAFTPERLPDVTQALHEFGNISFIATVQYFIFQNVGFAVVCLSKACRENSPFPRWLGYLSLLAAFSIEVGAVAFLVKTGPFSWNGLFVYWLPLSMYGVWFGVVSAYLFIALRKQASKAVS